MKDKGIVHSTEKLEEAQVAAEQPKYFLRVLLLGGLFLLGRGFLGRFLGLLLEVLHDGTCALRLAFTLASSIHNFSHFLLQLILLLQIPPKIAQENRQKQSGQ